MAVILTWVMLLTWGGIGLAVLRLGRHRWVLTTLLVAPAVGFAAVLVPTYILVRFGVPVRLSGPPVLAALVALSAAVLWRSRPAPARAGALWRQGRVFAAILVGAFGLTAWPMIGYGFDWIANGNDDMANYCLLATGYRDHGYAGVPNPTDLRAGLDQTRHYWFGYFLREVRPGSEVLLALTSACTGCPVVAVFMPVIVALNLALVAAGGALALAATRRRAIGAATAVLLLLSSQTTYGVVQQLIAQVGGLGLLCTALALVFGRFRRLPRPVLLRRAAVCGVVFAGQMVFYPEVIPVLVGGCVLLGLRDLYRRRLARTHLAHAAAAIAVMLALLPVYVYGSVGFMAHQAGSGSGAETWVKELFPFYLTPRLGALVWGLLPLAGPQSLPFQHAAVLVGLVLTVALPFLGAVGLRRGWAFAAALVVAVVMGAALLVQNGAFGLFKLAMFAQPFLWAAVAAWVLSRRTRWALIGACALVAGVAVQNARVQFWYVDQSRGRDCRVAVPGLSARHGFEQFRAEYARRVADGGVDRVLLASENVVLMKLVCAEVRGVPTGMLGVNPFDPLALDILPIIEDTPVVRRHADWGPALRALRTAYPDGPDERGPAVLDPETGATLHRLFAVQPERGGGAPERTLVVAPGGTLSVLNRYHQPEGGPLIVCAPLSEVRNMAAFCDATGARQYFLGMRKPADVALQMLEVDSYFRERTVVGVGRALVLDVLNPTPRVRVLVNVTGSFRSGARIVPPIEVVGDRRFPLGAVGEGSARLVSAPVVPQTAGPGRYLALEFGEPGRNPNRLSTAERLWGTDLPRDRRLMTGHLRDVSIISEEEYAAFRPPTQVSRFPDDLADPHLEYSGLFEEGWVGTAAKVRLTQSDGNQECVIRGQIPGLPGGDGFRTDLTVSIDGAPVVRRSLGPGEFEVRAAGGSGPGPHWVEFKFSHAQALPAPDERNVAAHLRSIGFEARLRPPEQIVAFPGDLNRPELEHAGIAADGWGDETFRARLWQAAPGAEVVVRGMIPQIGTDAAFRTELVLLLDGAEVARRELGPGAFELRGPAGKTAQARWVECRFSCTQVLPAPDGRRVGAHLRCLGFEPERPAP